MSTTDTHPSIRHTVGHISVPVWTLLGGTLVNKLGDFMVVFLVLFLTARGFSAGEASLALGVYELGAIVGIVAGGAAADRIGSRWTITISMLGGAILTSLLPHTSGLAGALLVSTGIGIAGQAYRPAAAGLLSALTPHNQQVMVFAIHRLALNLGMTAGPLLGVLLIRSSYDLLFYGDAVTSLMFGLLAAAVLPRHDSRPPAEHGTARGYRPILADRRYLFFLAALSLSSVVYIQYLSTLPLHVRAEGFAIPVFAALVSLNALIVICCEVPITQLTQRLPSRWTVMLGVGLIGLGLSLYALPGGLITLVVATCVWTCGEIVGAPAAFSYPGRIAPPALRARYIAAATAVQQVGYALGPIAGAAVWLHWGVGIWWLCGLVTIAAVACALVGVEKERQPSPA